MCIVTSWGSSVVSAVFESRAVEHLNLAHVNHSFICFCSLVFFSRHAPAPGTKTDLSHLASGKAVAIPPTMSSPLSSANSHVALLNKSTGLLKIPIQVALRCEKWNMWTSSYPGTFYSSGLGKQGYACEVLSWKRNTCPVSNWTQCSSESNSWVNSLAKRSFVFKLMWSFASQQDLFSQVSHSVSQKCSFWSGASLYSTDLKHKADEVTCV